MSDKDKALIYVINFFNSRMSAMSKNNVDKVKELITNHEISASELVNKYVNLVYKNSQQDIKCLMCVFILGLVNSISTGK